MKVCLENSRSGVPTLKTVSPDGAERLLHSSYDPLREARDLVSRFLFDGNGIITVLGLGLGYHVAELATRYPGTRIIVIEALSECEQLARKHGPMDFTQDRLVCLSGLTPAETLQKVTELQLQAGMPSLSLFELPSAVAAFSEHYLPIREKLSTSIELNLAGRLRHRKFGEDTKRILLFDCGYFLTREVATAITQSGHQVERFQFTSRTPVGQLMAGLVSKIAAFRPDFCLTINHLGFDEDGAIAQFLNSIEMPSASWFVDSPDLIIKGFANNVSPNSALFVWDRIYMDSMRQAGFEAVNYLPLATDPETFRPFSSGATATTGRVTQVGFVGNSMTKPLQEKLDKIGHHLHAVAKKLGLLLSVKRTGLHELFASLAVEEQQMIETLEARERLDFEKAVTWQATLIYRLACIEQLRSYRTVICGDKGWRKLVGNSFTLKPALNYYSELPRFYSTCSVNFNATSLQMGTAVNQRLFDVPACGGFLLTDHQESLEDLFVVGEEVITYQDRSEIPELVRFYLDNPTAREKVIARGRDRVLCQHTYRHRLQTMIKFMESRYA